MNLIHNFKLIEIADEFHHCASVVDTTLGPVIVGYVGQECTDLQRVFVWHNGNTIQLETKTGNPIVWEQNGRLLMMYSLYKDIDSSGNTPINPVQRWMYCDNYIVGIVISPHFLSVGIPELIPGGFGLLARCTPTVVDGVTLLPLYREMHPQCEIWEDDGGWIKRRGVIDNVDPSIERIVYGPLGKGVAIQPTLFNHDGKLIAWCRSVTPTYRYAWQSKSEDKGYSWSPLLPTALPNFNSSLVVFDDGSYVIHNPTKERDIIYIENMKTRKKLALGHAPSKVIAGQRRSFSYPNYCWSLDKKTVYVVHTNTERIALHEFSLDFLAHYV